MGTLAEGIDSIRLPCSLVLVIPALGVALLGPRRRWLVPAWIAVVIVIAWLRFVGWFTPWPSGPGHVASGVGLAALVGLAASRHRFEVDLAATMFGAGIAAWTWVPCVGPRLGDILNAARAEPWAQLGPTAAFFTGLFLPLIMVVAAQVAAPELIGRADRPALRFAGLAVLGLVGMLVALTLFDDLAGELARRSAY